VTIHRFELAGIPIPIEAGSAFAQHAYRQATRQTDLLMADNTIRRQIYAGSQNKLLVELSATDMPAPAGLASLDPAQSYTLRCGAPRTLAGLTHVIALPTARRTDAGYEPRGWAVVNGRRVLTPCNVAADTATLDAVTGASGYGVDYYPEIAGLVDFEDTANGGQARYAWRLTVREA